jgi:GH24 family phage-related lysozyme (muramidase)
LADLRNDAAVWARLLRHIREREGLYEYFYCDIVELVTIGYGELVDGRNAPDSTGQRMAGELADTYPFTTRTGTPATRAAVIEDWQRVKDYGRQHPNQPGRTYANVAQTRISEGTAEAILSAKIRTFADRIYAARPVLLQADSRIAAALVDARFNPSGVNVVGSDGAVGRMWNALTPNSPAYSPEDAAAEFEAAWAGRGNARYRQRHATRVTWFQEGARGMAMLRRAAVIGH